MKKSTRHNLSIFNRKAQLGVYRNLLCKILYDQNNLWIESPEAYVKKDLGMQAIGTLHGGKQQVRVKQITDRNNQTFYTFEDAILI